MAMSLIPFRLKKANAPSRFAHFNGQPSWADLASEIAQLFGIPSNCVGVAFITQDKEATILSTEQDLQLFYKSLDQSSEEIKFVVQDLRTPDPAKTITSTWSMNSSLSDLSQGGRQSAELRPVNHSIIDSADKIKLWCWIFNKSDGPFSVEIGMSKAVDDLKKAIKKEKEPELAYLAADSLDIWKLSLPIPSAEVDVKLRHAQTLTDIPGCVELNPFDDLSKHFSSHPRQHVHIVVKLPSIQWDGLDSIYKPSKKRRRLDQPGFDNTPDPNLARLYKLFWGTVNSDCFQEHAAVIPEIRTLSIEDVPSSKFTTIILPDGILFPFGSRNLLVTSVFKEFWMLITKDEEQWQAVQDQEVSSRFANLFHATIIKGQPGIGKTVFLSYVLVRRLQAKLPTVYCDKTEYVHIFDDSGVTKVQLTPGFQISELETNARCCALVNISSKVKQPPLQFFPDTRKGRVVVATSPDPSHVEAFSKVWPITSYCMPTWNWPELYFASLLWKGTLANPAEQNHSEGLRDVFSNYRGVPRICLFLFSRGGMKAYESSIQSAIRNIRSIEDLITSVKGPLPFNDNTSHRLVTIEPTLHSREEITTEITSNHIARLLFDRFQEVELFRTSQSIKNLLASSDTRGPGGALFEQAVHQVFCKGIVFKAEGISTKAPHLEVSIDAKAQRDSYFYHLRDTCAGKGSQDIDKSYLNRYMIPVLKNKDSIDSIWLSNDCTVLFQMTVSKDHALKSRGILTLLKELPANAQKDVRMVFVLPLGDEETSSFRKQPITPDIGEEKKVTEEIRKYHQYVYRFDYVYQQT